jgi:hypothetical protein
VTDALKPLGVKITELPMTPSRLWRLIAAARRPTEGEPQRGVRR